MNQKKVAILQSNYIPWKGYFDLINMVDEFILYDDAQYTKNDWRNRNMIKTDKGLLWLTIPVQCKGRLSQQIAIKEIRVSDAQWNNKHWKTVIQNYSRARHFRRYSDAFEELYLGADEERLSMINYRFISAICGMLGIKTRISWSMDYPIPEQGAGKTGKVIALCKHARAAQYISGPSARDYIDEGLFKNAGIELSYIDYSGYPEYSQMFGGFEHGVSIIDLIFNEGPDAQKYMKSF